MEYITSEITLANWVGVAGYGSADEQVLEFLIRRGGTYIPRCVSWSRETLANDTSPGWTNDEFAKHAIVTLHKTEKRRRQMFSKKSS